ncbi:MAG: hypothetical protein ACRCVE_03590, partial [Plesiomonas sp.]
YYFQIGVRLKLKEAIPLNAPRKDRTRKIPSPMPLDSVVGPMGGSLQLVTLFDVISSERDMSFWRNIQIHSEQEV